MKVRIWLSDPKEWREVEGEKVIFPGYEKFNFYATPAWQEPRIIRITEEQTGCIVGSGSNVIEAQKSARKNLAKHTPMEIEQRIRTLKEEQGGQP